MIPQNDGQFWNLVVEWLKCTCPVNLLFFGVVVGSILALLFNKRSVCLDVCNRGCVSGKFPRCSGAISRLQ